MGIGKYSQNLAENCMDWEVLIFCFLEKYTRLRSKFHGELKLFLYISLYLKNISFVTFTEFFHEGKNGEFHSRFCRTEGSSKTKN